MAGDPPQDREQLRSVRLVYLKKGGLTPEYINMPVPTEPIRLRFGPGRGTATKGVGSAWLMGSKTLLGSPFEASYQLAKLRFNTSTPNVYFAITHSRFRPGSVGGGTVDVAYLPTRSDDLVANDMHSVVESLGPGTIRFYALGPGSSISAGKGSAIKYQGFGSAAQGGVGVAALFYPI